MNLSNRPKKIKGTVHLAYYQCPKTNNLDLVLTKYNFKKDQVEVLKYTDYINQVAGLSIKSLLELENIEEDYSHLDGKFIDDSIEKFGCGDDYTFVSKEPNQTIVIKPCPHCDAPSYLCVDKKGREFIVSQEGLTHH